MCLVFFGAKIATKIAAKIATSPEVVVALQLPRLLLALGGGHGMGESIEHRAKHGNGVLKVDLKPLLFRVFPIIIC